MASNTATNIGTRKNFVTLGWRNFEPDQTGTPVQYASRREGLEFLGSTYHAGDSLPFDVGGVSYSAAAIGKLALYWDQEFLTPLA